MDRKASDVSPPNLSGPEHKPDDVEASNPKKLRYPFSVFFIIVNEFCERFSYYGMRTVLTLYLTNILRFNDNDAVVLYHTFISLCYFTPVLGAILADNYLGKFRTILYLSILYALGSIVLSVAAIPNTIPQTAFSIIGLVIIAFGTGGIKPCVSAFGGQQFVLPEQQNYLEKFFSVFYFSINAGSMISTFLTPVLREDVKCFGQDSCFSLAFGIPAVLMIISVTIFVSGKRFYKIKPPESNVMSQFAMCIGRAIKRKIQSKGEKHDHWLEYASDKYDMQLINDTKRVLAVALVFLPLPVFWALYDQQGSRWTLQATRMDGVLGSIAIKPDQIQIANPVMILLLVPLFESVIYPMIQKCFDFTPLRRIGVGMVLVGFSFIISGILELQLEPTYEKIAPEGKTQINFANLLPCEIGLQYDDLNMTISSFSTENLYELNQKTNFIVNVSETCGSYSIDEEDRIVTHLIEGTSTEGYSVFTTIGIDHKIKIARSSAVAPFAKSMGGKAKVWLAFDDKLSDPDQPITTLIAELKQNDMTKETFSFPTSTDRNSTIPPIDTLFIPTGWKELEFGTYEMVVTIDSTKSSAANDINIRMGGCYLALIERSADNKFHLNFTEITPPNSINILWQIPQYFVVTVAEVMFSVTGLQFSFTQAPISMRSVMMGMWSLIVAFGDLIVIIVDSSNSGLNQTVEFFLFSGIMFVAALVFMGLAMMYTYIDENNDDEPKEEPKSDDASKEESSDDSLIPMGLALESSLSVSPDIDEHQSTGNELEVTTVQSWLTETNLSSNAVELEGAKESDQEEPLVQSSAKPMEDELLKENDTSDTVIEVSYDRNDSLIAAVESAVAALDDSLEDISIEPSLSPLSPPEELNISVSEDTDNQIATEESTPEVSVEQTPVEPSLSQRSSLSPAEESTESVTVDTDNQVANEESTPEVPAEQTSAEPSLSQRNSLSHAEESTESVTVDADNQMVTEESTPEVPAEQTSAEPSLSQRNSLSPVEE